jgi:hypothetical protein
MPTPDFLNQYASCSSLDILTCHDVSRLSEVLKENNSFDHHSVAGIGTTDAHHATATVGKCHLAHGRAHQSTALSHFLLFAIRALVDCNGFEPLLAPCVL